ncbi:hypothetical protein IFM89_017631 [Coptis chinensis]|uniref:Anthocyanin acyltransferase n=1 Tax=Coptis chinensis TaxID=261450 RepID=A0A835LDY9_9MAGN|nr:hypothetical protein IFM89_017631 [Coptis chinensis]
MEGPQGKIIYNRSSRGSKSKSLPALHLAGIVFKNIYPKYRATFINNRHGINNTLYAGTQLIMALTYKVEVLEICQISPPLGSISTASLPLTFFDIPWLVLPPVQTLFYYELNHPKTYFMNTILPNIKHSLSLTLQHFYPLAGQLTWPQDSVKPQLLYMDGDSVPLTVAECDYDFDHLSGNLSRNADEFYPLVPTFEHAMSDDKLVPILALQVTFFANKGICIGITFNHTSMDGQAFHHFIKSWASICKSEGITSLVTESLPFYDRTVVKDRKGIEIINLNDLEAMNITKDTYNILRIPMVPIDKVRGTFVMSYLDIKKLKQWVMTRLDDRHVAPSFRISTFILISSYVWICSIKARQDTQDDKSSCQDWREYFLFSIDCRPRLDPPLPMTYFGNCVGGCIANGDRNELIGENGMVVAAELIANAIKNVDTELWSRMEKGSSYYKSLPPGRFVSVGWSPKFGTYETDFGWGRPKKTEMNVSDGGAIALNSCRDEEGAIEVSLVRDAVEMDAFASLFENTVSALHL